MAVASEPMRVTASVPTFDATEDLTHKGVHPPALAPNTLIDERYRILSVLGFGVLGNVYKVQDEKLCEAPVVLAMKEIVPQGGKAFPIAQQMEMFRREAVVLRRLKHDRIPKVYDFVPGQHEAYMVMDYIEGRDLLRVLAENQGPLDPATVAEWIFQLCDIVAFLHNQKPPVIFRDLKPNNIMLAKDGRIHLIDFGIARYFSQDHNTKIGTPFYAAPEMYEGHADQRSDIFALGAVMYHLLTNAEAKALAKSPIPLRDLPIRARNPKVSQQFETIIGRCLERNPNERFQNIDALLDALDDTFGISSRSNLVAARPSDGPMHAGGSIRRGTRMSGALRTARVRWQFRTDEEVRATPLVAHGVVYIGSYDHCMYALDATTGEMRWKFKTEGGICGKPAIWRDLLILGSEDDHIYALDIATGKEVWCYRTWNHVRSSPRIFDNRLFIGSDDGHMYSLDPRTGHRIWRYRTYREVRSSAAYANGMIFFGSNDEYLYGVDAESGETRWQHHLRAAIVSSPAVYDSQVYVGAMDFAIYALDLCSHLVAWREPTEKFVLSSPLIVNDRLYVGSTDRHMYCMDRRTGQLLWRYQTGHQVTSNPAHANDAIYFGSIDRNVYALDARYGKLIWHYETGDKVPGSPTVEDGVVYVGSCDHNVYALEVSL